MARLRKWWHDVPIAQRIPVDGRPVAFIVREKLPHFHLLLAYQDLACFVDGLLAAVARLVGVDDLPGERWCWALAGHLRAALYQFAVEVRTGHGDLAEVRGAFKRRAAQGAGKHARSGVLDAEGNVAAASGTDVGQKVE
jgi:hypothetical protein